MNNDSEFLEKVLLVYYLYKYKNRKIRSMYMRPIFERRDVQGEAKLVDELGTSDEQEYHHKYFRMDKAQFDQILEKLSTVVYHSPTHARPISLRDRLAITIRYLATGMKQVYLAMSYRISPASVSAIIREIMTAICLAFEQECIPEPNEVMWKKISLEFTKRWNFPNACGAIDGKHIRIKSPPNSGSIFHNYKGFFSIVLMAVVDAGYQFILVDIGGCGSISDGGIFKNSNIGKKLEQNGFKFPQPMQLTPYFQAPAVLLADDAFPLKPYLMKPFPGQRQMQLTFDQRIFNYRHSRARMIVENTFGLFQARFRIFETPIDGSLDLAKLIVKTAVILHNFLSKNKDYFGFTMDADENGEFIGGSWRAVISNDTGVGAVTHQGSNNATAEAFTIRDAFKDYFNSDGSVAWQARSARRGYADV